MSVVSINAFYRRTTKDLESVMKNHDGTQSPHEYLTTAKNFDHMLRIILISKFNRLAAV
jgi:hypothetical protein